MRVRLLRGVVGVAAALSLTVMTFSRAPGAGEEISNSSIPPAKGPKVEQPPAISSADMAARIRIGANIFRQYCIACHGPDGTGSMVRIALPTIPDFTRPAWHKERSDIETWISILDGKGKFMIPFRDRITQKQAGCLVALVRSFAAQPDKGNVNEQTVKKPVPPPLNESTEQRQRNVIRAQVEWQELQKKHIEEQLAEQIQQLERDAKNQVAQLKQQARRQIEILDAQKRLYLVQAESQLAQAELPAGNAAGRPPAISASIAEKLDKVLDSLENIDKRLQKLEKGPPQ